MTGSLLSQKPRMASLDALRGLLMVFMALDHSLAFISQVHFGEFWIRPACDYGGSLLAFFTRYLSHLCAPGFALLMGAGMVLFAASRGRQDWGFWRFLRHFWMRGLLLVFISLTLENFFWWWGFLAKSGSSSWIVFFSILATLGAAMMVGSFFLRLPALVLGVLGVLCVGITPFMLPLGVSVQEAIPLLSLPKILLFVPWEIPTPLGVGIISYSLMPWLGITLGGMALGKMLALKGEEGLKHITLTGLLFLAAFVVLRFAGPLGNIQQGEVGGLIGFLGITKYPPSPAFVCATLGWNCLLLGMLTPWASKWSRDNLFLLLGRVPFFFYLLHIAFFATAGKFLGERGLLWGYAFWILVVGLLYFPCRSFDRFKRSTSPDSPWRLL